VSLFFHQLDTEAFFFFGNQLDPEGLIPTWPTFFSFTSYFSPLLRYLFESRNPFPTWAFGRVGKTLVHFFSTPSFPDTGKDLDFFLRNRMPGAADF